MFKKEKIGKTNRKRIQKGGGSIGFSFCMYCYHFNTNEFDFSKNKDRDY